MGQSNTPAVADQIEYHEYDWGDCIKGSKEQLQELGIGVGCAYPGEPGAPKRRLQTRDPRNYEVTIEKDGDCRYVARLCFPGWPEPPRLDAAKEIFPGVRKREYCWGDIYAGRAEALAAAGLVRTEQLPGQPGMRKTSVRFLPDGTVFSGPPTANLLNCPKQIRRISQSIYEVRIEVSPEEADRRLDLSRLADAEWRRKVGAVPRPRRLQPGVTAAPARGHLHLVWSTP